MQRNTLQRQIILGAVKRLKTHPSIEEVYSEIQEEYPAISKTTVYRNLRQLAKNGIIHEVLLPDGLERYDAFTDQHYHFKCRNCGEIFDVDMDYLTEINRIVQKKHGFLIDEHELVFRGICVKCGGIRKKISKEGERKNGKPEGNQNRKKLDGSICRRKPGKEQVHLFCR